MLSHLLDLSVSTAVQDQPRSRVTRGAIAAAAATKAAATKAAATKAATHWGVDRRSVERVRARGGRALLAADVFGRAKVGNRLGWKATLFEKQHVSYRYHTYISYHIISYVYIHVSIRARTCKTPRASSVYHGGGTRGNVHKKH